MKIAAFDLGSHVAIAHNAHGAPRVNHYEAKGNRVERAAFHLAMLTQFFEEAMAAGGLDAVFYERPFARGMDATRSLWGVAGILEAVAASHDIPVLDATPKEIKSFSGKHDATKEDMILFASLTGYSGDNEHEADAWCLLRFGEATLKPVREKKGKKRARSSK